MSKSTTTLTLLMFLMAPAASAVMTPLANKLPLPLDQPLPEDPLQTTIYRLDNGLTVYMSPNHETPRVFAEIVVRVGSKDDPPQTTGLAHYLEHMLFKGTPKIGTTAYWKEKPHLDRIRALYETRFRTWDAKKRADIDRQIDAENVAASAFEVPNEIDRLYQQMGFKDINANTSEDRTVFFSEFPSNRAEAWAAVESDRFSEPVFRLFPTELEAVYEEKNRSMDNPDRVLEDSLTKALYPLHPYGRDVLGEVAHLKNPSLETLYRFFKTFYVPNNMAIVLSGDFDRAKMLELIGRRFGPLKPGLLPKRLSFPIPALKAGQTVSINEQAPEEVEMSWLTAPYLSPDKPAIDVMDMVMDNEAAGIVNLTLNQAQKVKDAGSYPSEMNESGFWTLWAQPKKDQSLIEARFLLLSTVLSLKNGDFTDDDVKAVVTHFEVMEKMGLESNMARAGRIAESFAAYEPWSQNVHHLDAIKRVTKADVLRVARKYLSGNYVLATRKFGVPVITRMPKPHFTPIAMKTPQLSWSARMILKIPAAEITPRWLVEGKDYSQSTLSSGKLYDAANPFNDLFELNFVFEQGQRQERDLCAALKLWDISGAGDLNADAFQKKLYALGTDVSVSCGEQEWSLSLSGLERNLWPSLELVRRRFENPNIAPDALPHLIDVQIGANSDNKKNQGYLSYALQEFALKGKQSDVLNELSDKEWRSLTAVRLKKILNDALTYQHRVGYVGTRGAGEISKLLETGGKFKPVAARIPVKYVDASKSQVYFLDRDMVQAQLGMSAPDEILNPAHAVDYQFLSEYLGGGMSSVIFQEIREARSLAYAAGGGYRSASYQGDQNELSGGLGCQADKTAEAAKLLSDILHQPPWSQDRFNEASSAIAETYRASPIEFRSIPGALMRWEDEGLPAGDPRPARFEEAKRYTLADLQNFAARFKDKPMISYLLGPEKMVGVDALKGLGDFRIKTADQLFPY
jgi:predicted Zn-dependent peptidase